MVRYLNCVTVFHQYICFDSKFSNSDLNRLNDLSLPKVNIRQSFETKNQSMDKHECFVCQILISRYLINLKPDTLWPCTQTLYVIPSAVVLTQDQ